MGLLGIILYLVHTSVGVINNVHGLFSGSFVDRVLQRPVQVDSPPRGEQEKEKENQNTTRKRCVRRGLRTNRNQQRNELP